MAVFLMGELATGAVAQDSLKVGVAEQDITPPVGFPMAGYFHERLADGQIDPLKAKAIVFRGNGQQAALVICDLTGVPNWAAKGFKGVSYSSIVMNPASPPVQDYVLFTFDDIYAGTDPANSPQGLVAPPNRLQMIRTADYKYVRYHDGGGGTSEQSEFYDLQSDGGDYDTTYGLPLEMRNLSTWAVNNFPIPPSLTLEQVRARNDLTNNLAAVAASRLQPRSANAPVPPEQLKLAVVRYSDLGGAHLKVQITFLSRADETYQVQKSNNLVDWPDLGDSIVGNNGPILRSYDMSEGKAFYRIQWAARS
jgi:hypothetical protein